MAIKIALPKGRLLAETAGLLQQSGWGLSGYHEGARVYRLTSTATPGVSARMFHEKDIPVQVVMGNYDLGICGLDWIEELLCKYPSTALVKVKNLGYGKTSLYVAASQSGRLYTLDKIRAGDGVLRIVSEYPNLAGSFAIKSRLRRFNIFPVWGAAEAYPPENAELALVSGSSGELSDCNLVPVCQILDSSAFLIANKSSWESKDLSEVLASLNDRLANGYRSLVPSPGSVLESTPEKSKRKLRAAEDRGDRSNTVWLALPDGHQQKHVVNLFHKAGIETEGYTARGKNRRPEISLENVLVKVIRPQDMPLQVANGNFDIAITGRDWLKEHLNAFPSSPVVELADLEFGWVRIVAVVSENTGMTDIDSLRKYTAEHSQPLRIASEYVNIADNFARINHLGAYRIVPTWGASEAFVPEDADVLIENTETGQTLARHSLRIIDTLFESTACLIGNAGSIANQKKGEKIKQIAGISKNAVEASD